jgi:acetoin:2,6-dichlorophenolindophenol oxidoreductase subunit alpha
MDLRQDDRRDLRPRGPGSARAAAATCTCSTPTPTSRARASSPRATRRALGQAFAFQRKGTDRIAVAVTGEGAANQGAFHESLNLAALWKLPVVFVVEDNDWGISVPRKASTSVGSNADRAAAYGMPGERVEDNDVEAVTRAARAVARARAGEGPSLLEVHTLRLWGHFEGDAQGYRPELADVSEHDPIPATRAAARRGVLDDARSPDQGGGEQASRRRDRLRQVQPDPRPRLGPRLRLRLRRTANP